MDNITKNVIVTYARDNYKKMFREPEGQLKYKFIVPGSVYGKQLWDWDSWLTNVALRQFVTEDISEYENDMAIGVDNDPSTFYRPVDSSGSIYLNCMMYKELEAVCYIGEILGVDVTVYKEEKEHLRKSVQEHSYDEKDGFYYSVDLNLLPIKENRHAGAPRHWDCLIQRIGCWSGFLAMWSGIATKEQAERMVKENLLDEKAFWAPYGVRTLSKYEKMYVIKPSGNPSCWLGPIWGISNYMVFHPESGEPIINPGFQNWNLLSLNMLAWLKGENIMEEF